MSRVVFSNNTYVRLCEQFCFGFFVGEVAQGESDEINDPSHKFFGIVLVGVTYTYQLRYSSRLWPIFTPSDMFLKKWMKTPRKKWGYDFKRSASKAESKLIGTDRVDTPCIDVRMRERAPHCMCVCVCICITTIYLCNKHGLGGSPNAICVYVCASIWWYMPLAFEEMQYHYSETFK